MYTGFDVGLCGLLKIFSPQGKVFSVLQVRICRTSKKLPYIDMKRWQIASWSLCCIILAVLSWKLDRILSLHNMVVQKAGCCPCMSPRDCFLQWIYKRKGPAIIKFGAKECSCSLIMTILQLFVILLCF